MERRHFITAAGGAAAIAPGFLLGQDNPGWNAKGLSAALTNDTRGVVTALSETLGAGPLPDPVKLVGPLIAAETAMRLYYGHLSELGFHAAVERHMNAGGTSMVQAAEFARQVYRGLPVSDQGKSRIYGDISNAPAYHGNWLAAWQHSQQLVALMTASLTQAKPHKALYVRPGGSILHPVDYCVTDPNCMQTTGGGIAATGGIMAGVGYFTAGEAASLLLGAGAIFGIWGGIFILVGMALAAYYGN